MSRDIALVVPAFNEEARLPAALAVLQSFFQTEGLEAQVIVADDGSEDSTAEVARRLEETLATDTFSIETITIDHRGKGAAVRAGMALTDAPVVGYCDTDLSAGPDAIRKVYTAVKGGADMAMGSRGLPESILPIRQPWYRERAGRTFNLILRKIARIRYADTQCGLKLFRREAAKQIFDHQRLDGFAFDAEVVVLALRLGYSIEEVPITWSHAEGSKVSVTRDSLRMARDVLWVVRRTVRGDVHLPGVPSDAAMELMVTSEEAHWWHSAKRALVRETLERYDCESPCLDIGCGGGGTLTDLACTMRGYGVDLSPRALAYAKERGLSNLALAEAAALPFGRGTFGTVLALDVMEHHPQPAKMLREARAVLRPNGALVVTVPTFQWMWSHHDAALGHYIRYTKPQLTKEVERAGFRIERITYFHSWLLPVAWLFRRVRSILGGSVVKADDFAVPASLNRMLGALTKAERKVLRRAGLPFGLSLLCVARRKETAGGLRYVAR